MSQRPNSGRKTSAPAQHAERLNWMQIRPAQLVLITGTAKPLIARALHHLKQSLKNEHPDLEIHLIQARGYIPGQLMTALSPSLFQQEKLVIVENLDQAGAECLKEIDEIFELLDERTVLVFQHAKGTKAKKLLEQIRERQDAIEVVCEEVTERNRVEFVQMSAHHFGARIGHEAAETLALAYGEELDELLSVIEQLAQDTTNEETSPAKTITLETVERMTAGRMQTTAFKIVDACCSGNIQQTLVLFRYASATGLAPLQIFGALKSRLRLLAQIIDRQEPSRELAGSLRLPPWMLDRARRQLRGWNETSLARTIEQLPEIEWKLKGGSKTPEQAFESFLISVATKDS